MNAEGRPVTVVLADDNAQMRDALAEMLTEHFLIADVAANGKQLVSAVVEHRPDVVVTDLWMPQLSGLDALRALRICGQTTPFVIVSVDPEMARPCLAAGAHAFVYKGDAGRELIPAVLAALHGKTYVSVGAGFRDD